MFVDHISFCVGGFYDGSILYGSVCIAPIQIHFKVYIDEQQSQMKQTHGSMNMNCWYACKLLVRFARLLGHTSITLPILDSRHKTGVQWPYSN